MNPLIKVLATNKKAFFDYEILEKIEAGIMLSGAEVKSIRSGKANLKGSRISILSDGPYVIDMHISPYSFSVLEGYNAKARRKILLNSKQIQKLLLVEKTSGSTIIPLELYLKGGLIKLQIAVVKGKKKYDKRDTMKKNQQKRDIQRALKHY